MDSQPQQSDQSLVQAPSMPAQAGGTQPALSQSRPASPAQPSSGADAEGTGLTEMDRAYIDKAIAAVEETSGDPYSQSQTVSSIRSDYLRERFGKQVDA
jgi:hypothetical protein